MGLRAFNRQTSVLLYGGLGNKDLMDERNSDGGLLVDSEVFRPSHT